jgi:hypothetical protein
LTDRLAAHSELVASGALDPADYAVATQIIRARLVDARRCAVVSVGKPAIHRLLASDNVEAAFEALIAAEDRANFARRPRRAPRRGDRDPRQDRSRRARRPVVGVGRRRAMTGRMPGLAAPPAIELDPNDCWSVEGSRAGRTISAGLTACLRGSGISVDCCGRVAPWRTSIASRSWAWRVMTSR